MCLNRIALACLCMLAFSPGTLPAQENEVRRVIADSSLYDNDFLPASFHQSRRALLREALPDSGMAVVFSAPVRVRSNDVNYVYHQDPGFYYYTGHRQPGAVLLVFKEPQVIGDTRSDEFLFVRRPNALSETWTGRIPSSGDVVAYSGVPAVLYNGEFKGLAHDFSRTPYVWVSFPADVNEQEALKGTAGWLAARFRDAAATVPDVTFDQRSLRRANALFREVKTDSEIGLLRKAIMLTCRGFMEALRASEPGMHEYELENINEYMWRKEGAEHTGFPSIVGGGHNSCVLHYETNRKKLLSGDMVVMDMGAEYHGYTADITRSFPVNGRFTREQAVIYNLVLAAQEAGLAACVPGNGFNEPHRAALKVIAAGLMELGIIDESSEARNYFMHGTSHYLGLDVHDAGTYGPLKPGSVITVEPGIYIREEAACDRRWWNIGVRIEDDVLITASGHEVLSGCVPKTIPEIEAIMQERSLFNDMQ